MTTCEYTAHIYGRYQSEMINGIWSRDARGLAASTVNVRVQIACDFLTWLAYKGHREPFEQPVRILNIRKGSATNAIAHRGEKVAVREGKVRKNKRYLRLPTDNEIGSWLSAVYERNGETKGLMCETILLTAMRRNEVASLRIDFISENPKEWHRNNSDAPPKEQSVRVSIKYGTKGTTYGRDNGDKIGPQREIWMPLDLAERLHEYRMSLRNRSLKKLISAASSVAEKRRRISESVHLFLDEKIGNKLSAKNLYDAWTTVDLPFKGWSPHLGRDWWACSVLWREIKRHELLRSLGNAASAALLESTAMSIIRLQIQPQLGHAHDSTSMIYLQWVADMLGVALSIKYEQDLTEEELI
ncbi:integrase [Massilia aurea]|uniref:Integrase n=1 Tax=Massilia aurea TaxID=373040 RepID=A0A7W9X3S1_9BURK|nr:site-specific integrase [Massilia aurea]MBB6135873.1 integrase [Massilia aurea]